MTINEIVARLDAVSSALAPLKKEYDALRKQVLAYAGDRDYFETDDNAVFIKNTPSTRLDTAALYKDFPDIKDVYNKTTFSRSVDIRAKQAEVKTA